MATGAYDSEGVWIYGEDDLVSPFASFMNRLASSVSARLGELSTVVGNLAAVTVLRGSWTDAVVGASSATIIRTTEFVTLTPGTWRVEAGATVEQTVIADGASCGVYNVDAASTYDDSRSPTANTSVGERTCLASRPLVLTVAVATRVCLFVRPNGASALTIPGTNLAGAPSRWLQATRIK